MIGAYTGTRDAKRRVGASAALRWAGHEDRPIQMGRQSWIGRGATVLPSVTKDILAHAVAAGVRARAIRTAVAAAVGGASVGQARGMMTFDVQMQLLNSPARSFIC